MCASTGWLGRSMCALSFFLHAGLANYTPAFSNEPPASTDALPPSEHVFSIRILDQQLEPLDNVAVVVVGHAPNQEGVQSQLGASTTRADGTAVIELPATTSLPPSQKPVALVWKAGYGLKRATLPLNGPLTLSPAIAQPLRVCDANSNPLPAARVEIYTSDLLHIPKEWKEGLRAETDQLGMCKLAFPTDSISSVVRIETEDKAAQFADISHRASVVRRSLDVRDTLFIHLRPTGSVTGSMPQALADIYRIRLRSENRYSANRGSPAVYWQGVVDPDESGEFDFHDIVQGRYTLHTERKIEAAAADEQSSAGLLSSVVSVIVQGGRTTHVELERLTGAEVRGRVSSGQPNSDFNGLEVTVVELGEPDSEKYQPALGTPKQLICDADGHFTALLPTGNYRFSVNRNEHWLPVASVSLTVGPGAAMLQTPELSVQAARKVEVRIAEETWQQFEAAGAGHLAISASGWGKGSRFQPYSLGQFSSQDTIMHAIVPGSGEPEFIKLYPASHPTFRARLIDLDPSPNLELALDRRANGVERNVAIRTRVVDGQGLGLPNVSLKLTARAETSITSSTGRQTTGSFRTSDVGAALVSGKDGWVELPPLQIFQPESLNSPSNTQTVVEKLIVEANTLEGEGFSQSQEFQFAGGDGELPDEIRIDDIVLKDAAARRMLDGRLLSKSDEPLAGRVVWLAQAPGMLRAVTNSQGLFHFDGVAPRAWLLSDVNWTIQPVVDMPANIVLREWDVVQPTERTLDRMPLEQRRSLAKAQLDKLPAPANGLAEPDAYLEPDKFFQMLAKDRFNDARLDPQRYFFVQLWPQLEEEKVRRLVDATASPMTRALLLTTLADRLQRPEIYAEAMDTVQLAAPPPDGSVPINSSVDNLICQLAIKLLQHGLLDPHVGKLQAVIRRHERMAELLRQRAPSRPEPAYVALCRALLKPETLRSSLDDIRSDPTPPADLQARVRRNQFLDNAAMLFPESALKLPIDTIPVRAAVWREMGKHAPLAAVELLLEQPVTASSAALAAQSRLQSQLFQICEAALRAEHPDAKMATEQLCRAIRDFDLSSFQLNIGEAECSIGQWCHAAETYVPELSRQVKWHTVLYHFDRRESVRGGYPTPFAADADPFRTALCISAEWPDLARHIAQCSAAEFKRHAEWKYFNMLQPPGNYRDLSLLTYFDPELAISTVDKMQAEREKARAVNPPAQGQALLLDGQIVARRLAIVRGLLLSESELLASP